MIITKVDYEENDGKYHLHFENQGSAHLHTESKIRYVMELKKGGASSGYKTAWLEGQARFDYLDDMLDYRPEITRFKDRTRKRLLEAPTLEQLHAHYMRAR